MLRICLLLALAFVAVSAVDLTSNDAGVEVTADARKADPNPDKGNDNSDKNVIGGSFTERFEDGYRQLNSLLSLAMSGVAASGNWELGKTFWLGGAFTGEKIVDDPSLCLRKLPQIPQGILRTILRRGTVRWCVSESKYQKPLLYKETAFPNEILGIYESDDPSQQYIGGLITSAEAITIEMGVLMNVPLAPVIVVVPNPQMDETSDFDAVVNALNDGICDASLPVFSRWPARDKTADFTCNIESAADIALFGSPLEEGIFEDEDVDYYLSIQGENLTLCSAFDSQSDLATDYFFPKAELKATFFNPESKQIEEINSIIDSLTAVCSGQCGGLVGAEDLNTALFARACSQIVPQVIETPLYPVGGSAAITRKVNPRQTVVDTQYCTVC